MLGSALSVFGNLPFAGADLSAHDILQVPPAASSGQLEGQWEDVVPASAVGNDVMQGPSQDPQHAGVNMTNYYGIPNYPELPGVSEVYTHELSSSWLDTPSATPVYYSPMHPLFQCWTWSRYSRTQK